MLFEICAGKTYFKLETYTWAIKVVKLTSVAFEKPLV